MKTYEMNVATLDEYPEGECIPTATADILASTSIDKEESDARWDEITDHKLIEWAKSPEEFEADGMIGPSNKATQKAFDLLKFMQGYSWPLPTGVLADGDGGIVFENRQNSLYQRVEIDHKGVMTLSTYRGSKLVEHVGIEID